MCTRQMADLLMKSRKKAADGISDYREDLWYILLPLEVSHIMRYINLLTYLLNTYLPCFIAVLSNGWDSWDRNITNTPPSALSGNWITNQFLKGSHNIDLKLQLISTVLPQKSSTTTLSINLRLQNE